MGISDRRQFLKASLVAGVSGACINSPLGAADALPSTKGFPRPINYRLDRITPAKLFDGKQSYCHPRAGIVPGAGKNGAPRVVMTLMTIDLDGNDVFRSMLAMTTDDLGKTWSDIKRIPELCSRPETIDGVERPVVVSDFWPTWHKASKTLLGTGHTVAYTPEWKVVPKRPRDTAYAAYDAKSDSWSRWQKLPMPDAQKFEMAGAGCTQRVDLADGTILLPIYYRPMTRDKGLSVTVVHCSFDGRTLKYLNHGDELFLDDDSRGLGEPSLTTLDGFYYLTLRHPQRGHVSRSRDGLHFEKPRPWTFDDGQELGSYETQQHWVTHSDGLFLVYTRRGANNDHVFRNRAPLFMAQVDPEKLVVLRKTERELMPNRGARYGNFGVTQVNRDETWVTDSEWMQPKGCEKFGSDGSVFVARIHWAKPNLLVS